MKPFLFDAQGRPTHFKMDDQGLQDRRAGGLVEPAPLPEVVAVEETMDPQTLRRARALKRLGGGPLFKAEQEAKRKKQVETQMGIKALFDGLRRRPVL